MATLCPSRSSARAARVRTDASSSMIRSFAMAGIFGGEKLTFPEPRPALCVAFDDADKWQLAKSVHDVHAVADDEIIGAVETDIICIERGLAAHALVEQ